jgi:hypothetical protein
MNHPMIIAASVDTKVVMTILFFVSAFNVALFFLGYVFSFIGVFVGKFIQRQRFKKFLVKPYTSSNENTNESAASFEINTKTVTSFDLDLHEVGDAIHNFGSDTKYFATDENGYILVSPEAAKTIRDCGSDIRMYLYHYKAQDDSVFEYICKKLHDACNYNNFNEVTVLNDKGGECGSSTHCGS